MALQFFKTRKQKPKGFTIFTKRLFAAAVASVRGGRSFCEGRRRTRRPWYSFLRKTKEQKRKRVVDSHGAVCPSHFLRRFGKNILFEILTFRYRFITRLIPFFKRDERAFGRSPSESDHRLVIHPSIFLSPTHRTLHPPRRFVLWVTFWTHQEAITAVVCRRFTVRVALQPHTNAYFVAIAWRYLRNHSIVGSGSNLSLFHEEQGDIRHQGIWLDISSMELGLFTGNWS